MREIKVVSTFSIVRECLLFVIIRKECVIILVTVAQVVMPALTFRSTTENKHVKFDLLKAIDYIDRNYRTGQKRLVSKMGIYGCTKKTVRPCSKKHLEQTHNSINKNTK